MDKTQLQNWQSTVDTAEFTPLASSLPDTAVLGSFEQEGDRLWQRILIRYGRGQWAYWINKDEFTVCADTIFNMDASHFAGFLARPHGIPVESTEWLLIEPRVRPIPSRTLHIEEIERSEGRYETNDIDRIPKG